MTLLCVALERVLTAAQEAEALSVLLLAAQRYPIMRPGPAVGEIRAAIELVQDRADAARRALNTIEGVGCSVRAEEPAPCASLNAFHRSCVFVPVCLVSAASTQDPGFEWVDGEPGMVGSECYDTWGDWTYYADTEDAWRDFDRWWCHAPDVSRASVYAFVASIGSAIVLENRCATVGFGGAS